jgi:peptide/nickel transport system permease protein
MHESHGAVPQDRELVPRVPHPRATSRHPLIAYGVRRAAVGVALLACVSVLVFFSTQALGDPASAILGRYALPSAKQELRKELGLDHPVLVQYKDWLIGFVQGDFGRSLASRQPVSQYLSTPIKNTFVLAFLALAVIVPLALLLGVWSGVRPNGPLDHWVSAVSLAAIALPEFATGTILSLVFAVKLGILPPVSLVPPHSSPLSHIHLLILPVATLTLAGLAYLVRMVRAGVIEAMDSEYVQMARLNGLTERRVIWFHGVRNALATTIQVLAQTIQWLIGGVVITETLFAYPGFGRTIVFAVTQRDIPVVQAGVLLVAAFYIGINILADVVVVLLIPKLRTAP